MDKRWRCARCSAENDERVITCASCGYIHGGVVVEPSATTAPLAGTAQPSTPGPAPVPDTAHGGWLDPSTTSERAAATPDQAANAATAAPPRSRRIPVGWLAVIAIVVVSAAAGLVFTASRGSTGEIAKPGDLTASDLRIGDCFDLKDPGAETVGDVTARPCADEHEFEMYAVATMPAGDFPAQATLDTFANDTCVPAFEGYVGKAYTDSELEIFVLQPTSQSWGGGDRSVQCAVYHPLIHRLTGSLKGSSQ